MMIKKELFKTFRISNISCDLERIFFVDEYNRIFEYDKDLIRKKAFKIKFSKNKANEKGVKFSNNLELLAISSKNKTSVWNLEEKKKVGEFERKDDVLSVCFDDKKRYIFTGGINGEIYQINLKTAKKSATVAKHRDFIVDLVYEDEYSQIVAGCYDKCVLFISGESLFKKERYLHIKPVKKVDNTNRLLSADGICDIIKWDIVKDEKKDRVDFYKEFRDFCLSGDILCILSANKVILYDIENEVILNDNFLDFQDGDKIKVFNNYMIISDINGKVSFFDLFEDEKEFLRAILKEDFVKAYDFIDKNPFLKRSKGYERLQRFVELLIKRAKALYETDKFEGVKILEKLMEVPQLRSKIEKIMLHYENLIKFKNAVLSKNYSLAYILAEQFPLLKETKYYQILEKIWDVSFKKAYNAIIKGDEEKAREILEPFMGVPQKVPLIKLLLQKAEVFRLMYEKISKKDFKGFFELVKLHEELKNTKEYQKVMEYGEKLYKYAINEFKKEEFEKAKKAALILKDFPGFEQKAAEILNNIQIALKFIALFNENRQKALEMVEIYPFLKDLEIYKNYINKWNEDLYKAENEAAKGNREKALGILEKYQNTHHIKRINEFMRNY